MDITYTKAGYNILSWFTIWLLVYVDA